MLEVIRGAHAVSIAHERGTADHEEDRDGPVEEGLDEVSANPGLPLRRPLPEASVAVKHNHAKGGYDIEHANVSKAPPSWADAVLFSLTQTGLLMDVWQLKYIGCGGCSYAQDVDACVASLLVISGVCYVVVWLWAIRWWNP